jgi:hypothetical protein
MPRNTLYAETTNPHDKKERLNANTTHRSEPLPSQQYL